MCITVHYLLLQIDNSRVHPPHISNPTYFRQYDNDYQLTTHTHTHTPPGPGAGRPASGQTANQKPPSLGSGGLNGSQSKVIVTDGGSFPLVPCWLNEDDTTCSPRLTPPAPLDVCQSMCLCYFYVRCCSDTSALPFGHQIICFWSSSS